MKKQLPSLGLKLAWTQTKFSCGEFEKADQDNLKETRIDKYDVIEVPFHFRKDKRILRLAFNSEGEISGMYFLPMN